jgi:hypothetical protein
MKSSRWSLETDVATPTRHGLKSRSPQFTLSGALLLPIEQQRTSARPHLPKDAPLERAANAA